MAQPNRRIAPGFRRIRLGDQPVLSVVLFARDPASLEAQLPALARCCRAREVELVVVGPIDGAAAQQYESQWTGVRFVSASPSADEAQLRRLGLVTAQGDIVAFTDGERSVAEGWLDRLVQGARGEDDTYGDDGAEPLVPGNRAAYPFVSVVVPAHQAATVFTACLEALEASNLPRTGWELVVVDDASTDDTELIAAEHADTVVRLAGNPHGPAYARNRGAEVSRGDVLVFVDADVLVHPDALRQFADLFAGRPDLSAAFGSYDSHPRAAGLVSQYRNLLHHYVHHANPGPAETFWAGLGAVRRNIFLRVGAFDEWHYSRPQIEDIEFGRRLRRDGYEIWLEPTIQGTHLKRWTLASMLVTDFQNRGVPWMWLLLQEGQSAGSRVLNLRQVHKLCTALIGVVLGALFVSLFGGRGPALACAGVGLTGIVFLNFPFYNFLWRCHGLWFAATAIPLHLGYYAVSFLSVGSGWILHIMLGEPVPPAEKQALAQVGLKTWPPQLRQRRSTIWSTKPSSKGPEPRPQPDPKATLAHGRDVPPLRANRSARTGAAGMHSDDSPTKAN